MLRYNKNRYRPHGGSYGQKKPYSMKSIYVRPSQNILQPVSRDVLALKKYGPSHNPQRSKLGHRGDYHHRPNIQDYRIERVSKAEKRSQNTKSGGSSSENAFQNPQQWIDIEKNNDEKEIEIIDLTEKVEENEKQVTQIEYDEFEMEEKTITDSQVKDREFELTIEKDSATTDLERSVDQTDSQDIEIDNPLEVVQNELQQDIDTHDCISDLELSKENRINVDSDGVTQDLETRVEAENLLNNNDKVTLEDITMTDLERGIGIHLPRHRFFNHGDIEIEPYEGG